MARAGKTLMKVVMVGMVILWHVPQTTADGKAEEATKAPTLCAGKVVGTVIDADGKTPVGNVSVKAYDHKGKKLVYATTTDKKGKYSLKPLKPGIYRLIVADRVMTEVTVMTDGEIVELDFRIPHVYLAPKEPEDPKSKTSKGTKSVRAATARFALVTVGVGVAVAVPLALTGGKTAKKYYPASPDS